MTVNEFLARLDGVKGGHGQWTARCPAHDDRRASLSVSVGEGGRVLLNCHAGCSTEDICAALGLSVKDLFMEDKPKERPQIVEVYPYHHDLQKIRYSDKSFLWRRPDGKGGWIWNRQGVPNALFQAGELTGVVAIAEGEKDVLTLHRLGWDAACGEHGAGKDKWKPEYSEQLRGLTVVVFMDNDNIGRAYGAETAAALYGVAASVRLLDLSRVWDGMPEHADISDLVSKYGDEKACEMVAQLINDTPEWEPPPPEDDPFLSCFKTLDTFEEEEAEWTIPNWIPKGQIALLAADGGVGKTSLWVNIISALSSGGRCILDPPNYQREPQRVAFLTTEDSVRQKLKKKLRLSGANMANIITPDFLADKSGALRDLKFGSPSMERFIKYFRPAICIFDPVQGFLSAKLNMGSRNEMRDAMAPLISLGEETGTTFLVICHTNKRKGAWGRDRIADSADLWDVSRSVLMAGYTDDKGIRYLSNEKNNYTELQETLLFTITESGQVKAEGTSWKRDREYTQESAANTSPSKKDDCKTWILNELDKAGGSLPSKDLESNAKAAGYSFQTLRRAKEELKNTGQVKYFQTGGPKEKVWHVQRVVQQEFMELPNDTPTPWTD